MRMTATLTICLTAATVTAGALFLPDTDPAAGGDAGAGGAPSTLTVADFAFTGLDSTPTGSTITVANDDAVPHTLTATDGTFDTGLINGGDAVELTLTRPGTFAVFCEVHPSMTATLTVTG